MWRLHQALLRRISPLKHPAGWPARGIRCYYATEPKGRKPKTAPLQVIAEIRVSYLESFGDELYICTKYFRQDIDSENNGLNTLFTTAAQQHNKNFS
uniref:Uncharacterized protein n=1 Tax=Oryza sativa subsp. japonica TaxID=39947 RepID=Q6Z631_ORYSJ|nr:hypothetical protein [Oryza sativa Japonica Group]